MKVLVACEFSATVRDAFRRRGHDAWSVDLLPTEGDPAFHIQGDALDAIGRVKPDLLIAHPPCTYLANSGVRWLYGKGRMLDTMGLDPIRFGQMEEAAQFFDALLNAPVAHIAVENPVMHGYARQRIHGEPTQTIQPWQFGHPEVKATQLWLRNLPPLQPTDIVPGREAKVHRMSPGPNRWRERSRTYPGIAEAMADQWGALV